MKRNLPNGGKNSPRLTGSAYCRYERAVVAMAKQRVTLEVLSYHATAPVEEALKLKVSLIRS